MAKIWANRLIAGTKVWEEVPAERKGDVLAELKNRVENGKITADKYTEITGKAYA